MEEKIPEVRASVLAAAGAADERPTASPPPTPLWWRALSFFALRVADTVFYAMCAALCLASVGSALALMGLRIGGSAGTRAAEVGGSVIFAGQCLLPVGLVATPLYVFFAVSSDKEPSPPRESKGSKLGAVLGFVLSDSILLTHFFYFLAGVGCLTQFLSRETASFWEKAGSLVFCGAVVGVAIMHCCFICPLWIRQWRSGQRNRVNKKN